MSKYHSRDACSPRIPQAQQAQHSKRDVCRVCEGTGILPPGRSRLKNRYEDCTDCEGTGFEKRWGRCQSLK